ncbi:MAG: hypothetical protein L6R40_006368 [Gallowayella cf. fulva]|nr:MAG: hypothetical protein L6R40_006368 [Xanthomendoza cf. fulva]
MRAWNPADVFGLEKAACLHHLVENIAHRMPEAEAICAWDGTVSYGTLNALSNIAGQRLRRYGVKPGVYVPFAYEKSLWTVVACLGILKAGGAFVPISVHEPDARLLAILMGINTHVLVTSRHFETKFRAFVVNVVVIDASTMEIDTHWTEESSCDQIQPTDPVFILFTSGSTGQPKGMIHDHASICTQWLLQGEVLGYHGARVLQFAAHTFDVFIIDVFTALLYGGCVCIPSEEDRQNNIVGVINRMKADYAILTPSFAGLIEPSEVPTLKTLSIGGEALPQERVQRWAEKVRFIQIYGPAEVGICLAMDMKPSTRPETIGYPLPHCSCWLVDPEDSECLVPIGAVGELLVAGPSLARGYLNDQMKTQACFIGAPSWARTMGHPFAQFYKTGDLLRLNTDTFDGCFDFVGRKDYQIKLRGQRIEPGEVEYHLGNLSGVAHALVTKPEGGPYVGQLVAVVQTRIDQGYFQRDCQMPISTSKQPKLSLSIVRDSLSKLMPSYMVPGVLLEVDAMPCVPSMKIDRKLVQAWLEGLTGKPASAVAERFPVIVEEGTAQCIGQAVSDLIEERRSEEHRQDTTSPDYVLQDTGVDSIQIISLAMFIKRKFGVKIPAPMLLNPVTTVKDIAAFVETHRERIHEGPLTHGNGVSWKSFNLVQEFESLCMEFQMPLSQDPAREVVYDEFLQPRNIFLTGATGFLGTAILHNLLEDHQSTNIYALVRCSSEHEGLLRLLQALDSQGRWRPAYLSRLIVIRGDLEKDNLGMSMQDLSMLQFLQHQISYHDPLLSAAPPSPPKKKKAVEIDTIIHAAAKVHYSTSYATLKKTNTSSVLFLLKAFTTVPTMRYFVYISGGEQPTAFSSLTDPLYVKAIEESANGYTQSKVLGEQLVRFAIESGLEKHGRSVSVVKPGYMIGDSEIGIANQSDFLWRLIRGCIEIGHYDAEADGKWVFVSDVQYIAARVLENLFIPRNQDRNGDGERDDGRVERVFQGLRFEDIWSILKEFGYTLEAMETDSWMEMLLGFVEEEGERHLLFPLLDILEMEGRSVGIDWHPTGRDDDGRVKVQQAFRRNVEHLIEVEFLPGPGHRADLRGE